MITILECVCEKRGRCNLLITDQNQACFAKMSACRVQEELTAKLDTVYKLKSEREGIYVQK